MLEGGGWGVMVCADAADKDTSPSLPLARITLELNNWHMSDIRHQTLQQ